jgi:uncharacterized membrane protein YkvA (DUF1232 family)
MGKYEDFYFELRREINKWLDKKIGKNHRWSEFILATPDLFHLLVRLLFDKDVPQIKKVKLAAAVFYFISPIDFIPEALLGPAGYVDDIAVSAYVLNDLINDIDQEIVYRNWTGDKDILELVKSILGKADLMIGSGLWNKLKKNFAK